ncbi:SH3 domain-containing protein [Desulfolithobacter dissulfuricans]|uniref:SH3 domain-containing protein n=1 Tax=Desulfolithobacter dissulfuricans TaxID=2795293 RepID=UPI0022777E81|nr:SH3 domain-containing protein [Desulfolithobacter dissulfuricans]
MLALLWYRKTRIRGKRIFFNSKKNTKDRLRLPKIKKNNRGNINVAVTVSVVFLVVLFAGYEQVFGSIRMVSIAKNSVNMRSGPGTQCKVLWELDKGYPLQVLRTKGNWYKVRDFEGDTGWVYRPLTSRKSYVVVKKNIINIRSGPGLRNPIIAKAHRGVVLRTIASVKGWVKVRHGRGVTGWVARRLVWGW